MFSENIDSFKNGIDEQIKSNWSSGVSYSDIIREMNNPKNHKFDVYAKKKKKDNNVYKGRYYNSSTSNSGDYNTKSQYSNKYSYKDDRSYSEDTRTSRYTKNQEDGPFISYRNDDLNNYISNNEFNSYDEYIDPRDFISDYSPLNTPDIVQDQDQCGCYGSRNTPGCTFDKSGKTDDELNCVMGTGSTIKWMKQFWGSKNCPNVLKSVLNEGKTHATNLKRTQTDIDELFLTYTQEYGFDFTSDTTSKKYNDLQEDIISLCKDKNFPDGCDLALSNYCNQFTRDQIKSDKTKAQLCGCYTSTTKVLPECDSLCDNIDVVQKTDPCTGTFKTCSNGGGGDGGKVCTINDEANQLFNNTIKNCSTCTSESPCKCIIEGENLVQTLNAAGLGANYTQICNKESECFVRRNGDLVKATCPTQQDFNTNNNRSESLYWIFYIVIFIIIIFIMIMFYFFSRSVK